MRYYRKLWGSRVPGWALGLGAKGYHGLMALVNAEANARGLGFHFEEEGSVRLEREGGPTPALDLKALARVCSERPRAEWDAVVVAHLEAALRGR